MTLSELAKLAGVSVSTASKAFSDAKDISEETRARVLDAARESGCFGKFYRGRHEKRIIAIICPELGSAYYNHQIEIFQSQLEKSGAIVLVSADHFDPVRQSELIDYYASYLHVDGLIVFHLRKAPKKGADVPIISIGRDEWDAAVDCIQIDLETPIREAVAHLKALGHRQIGFISEERTKAKLQYFRQCMAELMLPLPGEHVVVSEARFESAGAEGMERLLQAKTPCTAVICAYDYIALGAIRCLSQHGLQAPEDISVIGMDNINISGYLSRTLTTIDSHAQEVCEIACELLQKKMQHAHFRVKQQITVSGTLVLRDSVGPACKRKDDNDAYEC